MLHVGRSTVREALNGLAMAGVLEVRHGQGCFVASGDEPAPAALERALRRGETSDLMEARLLVEVEMLGLAAERATPEDIRRAEEALKAYRQAVDAGTSIVKVASRLHMRLLEAAHNEVLLGFVRIYGPKVLERGHELEEGGPRSASEEYEEHAKLLAAVLARDPRAARERMREHLGAMEAEISRVEKS
jgi:GntR family transcriptional repressor for pyruvate dehydrogenase complex